MTEEEYIRFSKAKDHVDAINRLKSDIATANNAKDKVQEGFTTLGMSFFTMGEYGSIDLNIGNSKIEEIILNEIISYYENQIHLLEDEIKKI